MSLTLRIILILAAIALFAFIMRSIRRSKMQIEDAIFWAIISLLILIISIFPGIVYAASDLLGFQAPVNLLYLFFIFILLVKCFQTSRHASQLETKIRELSQQISIDRLDHHDRSAK